MRTLVVVASLLALLAARDVPSDADRPDRSNRTIRVLTYNIHHGEGPDGRIDLPRLAAVIADTRPDLVALQEVDEGTARAAGVHQVEELGRLTRMHHAFGQTMEFEGGGYGVGVLSRWRMLSVENHPLPRTTDREPRTALTVSVSPGRGLPRVAFTSTHFDSGRDVVGKNAQAAAINQMIAGDRDSLRILAGDLNSRDDSDVVRTLREQWMDGSPTDNPGMSQWGWPWMRVDHVLARPLSRWRVLESRRLTDPTATTASDHLPVLVVLEISAR
jgi:endonuclease/exonuclease/phosphatase family metal-dependent hydrolase